MRRRFYRKNKDIIYIVILSILIIAWICSLSIFVLATNKIKEDDVTTISNQPPNNYENNINQELNEEKEQEQTFEVDKKALAQINTKTRKTPSGKKYTSIGLINIPSLNIKYQILSDTSEELLRISVNKYWGSNPNEVGNLCILGHNYKNSRFFGNLPKIKKGEKIYITDLKGQTLTYKVYKTDIIKDDDVECTSQKTNGNIEVTLITCYYEPGYKHATKRFIAKARVE